MPKLIRVEFTDGTSCEMIPKALNLFLKEENWVRCFWRSNGRVWVGFSPLRNEKQSANYQGSDRRMIA